MPQPSEEELRNFVVLDAMGGDHGPGMVVRGAIKAWQDFKVGCLLVGDQAQLESELSKTKTPDDFPVCIQHAEEVVTMEDSAASVLRTKRNASIRVAYEALAEGRGCAVVSPGNTGAFMAAGVSVCGTLPGIGRPAIASLIPRVGSRPPVVLLDSGANIDCHAEQLVQFAIMGDNYARTCASIGSPRVAVLSNGTEQGKGNDLTRAAASILHDIEELNFIGYVEGSHITKDVADVIVCDGFVGNVVLKTIEGTVELVLDSLKHYVEPSVRGKLGLLLCKPIMKKIFQSELDPSAYGGAPLLGLNEVAIVCHGSSKEKAIANAIEIAKRFADERLVDKIGAALGDFNESYLDGIEDGVWSRVGQHFERGSKFMRRKKKEKQKEGEKDERTN